MKDVGVIKGSAAQAIPLVIGVDRVDVHTDIAPVTQDQDGKPIEGLFQYREVQYEKDEYIRMMDEQNKTNTSLINTILGVTE